MEFEETSQVISAVHTSADPGELFIDLADSPEAVKKIRDLRPDRIIIAGAFCNVEKLVVRTSPRPTDELLEEDSATSTWSTTTTFFRMLFAR